MESHGDGWWWWLYHSVNLLNATELYTIVINQKNKQTTTTKKPSSQTKNWVRLNKHWASLVIQLGKNLPAMRETWVWSLGWEDLLEKEMATHSSILAWRIPQMEEPGRLQSMGSQRVGHDWVASLSLSYVNASWFKLFIRHGNLNNHAA